MGISVFASLMLRLRKTTTTGFTNTTTTANATTTKIDTNNYDNVVKTACETSQAVPLPSATSINGMNISVAEIGIGCSSSGGDCNRSSRRPWNE